MTTMTTRESNETTTLLSDDELMIRLTAGEVEPALSTLRTRHQRVVTQLVHKIVQDRHTADDVAQEVFMKVFFKSHLYEPGTNFRAWMLGIARNQALNTLRRERRSARPVSGIDLDPDVEFDGQRVLEGNCQDRRAEEHEFMAAFRTAVDALSPNNQVVFRECVVEGRPYREVAAELGLPIGTVAIRIMRARQRLFGQLSQHIGRLRRPPACVQ